LAADVFLATLQAYLRDTFSDVDELINRDAVQPKKKKFKPVKINIRIIDAEVANMSEEQKEDKHFHYELSKLHGRRHPLFNIDYFRTKFSNNEEILTELDNMEKNLDSDLEYYSSYEYIKYLLGV
jgi:hypothetical protein